MKSFHFFSINLVAVLKDELVNGAKIGKNLENGMKLFTCLTTILLYLFILLTFYF